VTDRTSIEWTDATWNPLRGCSRVSEGCRNCYAEKIAARYSGVVLSGPRAGQRLPFHGVATAQGWNGKVELVEDKLTEPLSWREPRRVFVNSMSDLFHKDVPDEWIDRVFAVMALAPRHTFQVLTKRPERMRDYVSILRSRLGELYRVAQSVPKKPGQYEPNAPGWPFPHVWLGVSVENQATANARIPLLLETPAARRFVSYEPALGPVSFRWARWDDGTPNDRRLTSGSIIRDGKVVARGWNHLDGLRMLDWIIVGGESGPAARPFDVAWARSTIAQCREAGVACFVKQLGRDPLGLGTFDPRKHFGFKPHGGEWRISLYDRKGGDMAEWPEDLRVREFPRDPSVSPSVSPEIRS
jgi:protein gp37